MGSFDPSRPNVARVYDYLLDGKDHFAADRAVGDHLMAAVPGVEAGVRAQRAVLGRVVRYLVSEIGIRQLLDVGSGLPTADNVHEIAHRADPSTRVVYVDNDPVVLAHATALLADNRSTFAVHGDLFEPPSITENPAVRAHLDWGQPIGLLMCGILHYVLDSDGPMEIISALVDAASLGLIRLHPSPAGQWRPSVGGPAGVHGQGAWPREVPHAGAGEGTVRRP